MDGFQKQTAKSIVAKAVVYCIACMLLFFADHTFWGSDVAVQQIPFILLISTVFFSLGIVAAALYMHLMRTGRKKSLMTFYLLHKAVRLMVAVLLIVVYAFADKPNLLTFAMNLFVFYLVGMIMTLIHSMRMERLVKIKQ